MLESGIEKKVSARAKNLGWLSYKFTSPNNRSVPDRLYIKDGQVIFIEFKQAGKVPTKLQEHTIKKMTEHGAIVYVVDSVEKGYGLFESF